MSGNQSKYLRQCLGFTLIELLVVMVVIAVLLTMVYPKYFGSIDKSKEAVLQQDLNIMRDAIDKYFGDTGKYPMSLNDLVDKKYIKKIPVDPITQSADTWIIITSTDISKGKVYDIKSGSGNISLSGEAYSNW